MIIFNHSQKPTCYFILIIQFQKGLNIKKKISGEKFENLLLRFLKSDVITAIVAQVSGVADGPLVKLELNRISQIIECFFKRNF